MEHLLQQIEAASSASLYYIGLFAALVSPLIVSTQLVDVAGSPIAADPYDIGPKSFVGRQGPAGVRQNSFAHVPFPRYSFLLTCGILSLQIVQFGPRVKRRLKPSRRHAGS
jgi:hypothetical protein